MVLHRKKSRRQPIPALVAEVLLMADDDDALEVFGQRAELLDHPPAAVSVEAAEALVDDEGPDRRVAAQVLTKAGSEPDGDAELLAY